MATSSVQIDPVALAPAAAPERVAVAPVRAEARPVSVLPRVTRVTGEPVRIPPSKGHLGATAHPSRLLHPVRPVARRPVPAPALDSGARMEDLVRQYRKLIRVMVARVGRRLPLHVREDVEQRVLISLWKQLRQEQSIQHPTTYIYKAAVRETMRVRRREDARGQEPLEEEGSAGEATHHGHDPHATLDRQEKMTQIRAALQAISPERREAVRAHLMGFDVAEIMRRHGWSYHKARNLISRGLADVRRVLQENGWAPMSNRVSSGPCSALALKARAYQLKLRMLRGSGPFVL